MYILFGGSVLTIISTLNNLDTIVIPIHIVKEVTLLCLNTHDPGYQNQSEVANRDCRLQLIMIE